MIVFWVALAVLVAAFVAGVVFVVVRALETVSALRDLKDALSVELQRLARAGERTSEQLEATTKKFERLDASLKRFNTVQAQMRLINEAFGEAAAILTRARSFIPSK